MGVKSLKKHKKIIPWIALFLNILFLVAAARFVEFYCETAYYKSRFDMNFDFRGIRLREHKANTNTIYNINNNQVVFKTDSLRRVVPSGIHLKPDLKFVFLGGSTTECRHVNEKLRYPYLFGRNLEFITNKKVNTYNYGLSGNHSMHNLNILNNLILGNKPDFLFIHSNFNDLITLVHFEDYWNTSKSRSLVGDLNKISNYRVDYPTNSFIKRYFPYTALILFPTIRFGDSKNVINEWDDSKLPTNLQTQEIINLFSRSVESIVLACHNWDITPILFTQGNNFGYEKENHVAKSYSSYPYDIPMLHKEFNEEIRKISRGRNVKLFDLEKLTFKRDSMFLDEIHFNEQGSSFVAKKLTEFFCENFQSD